MSKYWPLWVFGTCIVLTALQWGLGGTMAYPFFNTILWQVCTFVWAHRALTNA